MQAAITCAAIFFWPSPYLNFATTTTTKTGATVAYIFSVVTSSIVVCHLNAGAKSYTSCLITFPVYPWTYGSKNDGLFAKDHSFCGKNLHTTFPSKVVNCWSYCGFCAANVRVQQLNIVAKWNLPNKFERAFYTIEFPSSRMVCVRAFWLFCSTWKLQSRSSKPSFSFLLSLNLSFYFDLCPFLKALCLYSRSSLLNGTHPINHQRTDISNSRKVVSLSGQFPFCLA